MLPVPAIAPMPRNVMYVASMLIQVSSAEPVELSFPCGIAHGWLFITDAKHLLWPEMPKIVSTKANAFGSLAEARAKIEKTMRQTSSAAMDRQFRPSA